MTQVRLAPEVEDYVNTQVERDVAATAEDYVNDVLRARHEEEDQALDELWAELEIGIADIEAGRVMSAEEAFASVREELGPTKPGAK